MIPSKSLCWLGEKYHQKKENGFDVDYTKRCEAIYKCYEEYHLDAVQIFLDQMKEADIRPWVSFRMNDAHCGYVDTSFMHSDLFYEELAAGHMIGDQYGYFGRCFDYTYPNIRMRFSVL